MKQNTITGAQQFEVRSLHRFSAALTLNFSLIVFLVLLPSHKALAAAEADAFDDIAKMETAKMETAKMETAQMETAQMEKGAASTESSQNKSTEAKVVDAKAKKESSKHSKNTNEVINAQAVSGSTASVHKSGDAGSRPGYLGLTLRETAAYGGMAIGGGALFLGALHAGTRKGAYVENNAGGADGTGASIVIHQRQSARFGQVLMVTGGVLAAAGAFLLWLDPSMKTGMMEQIAPMLAITPQGSNVLGVLGRF